MTANPIISVISIVFLIVAILWCLIGLLYVFSKRVQSEWIVAFVMFFMTFVFYIVIDWTVGYIRELTDLPLMFWEWRQHVQ